MIATDRREIALQLALKALEQVVIPRDDVLVTGVRVADLYTTILKNIVWDEERSDVDPF